MSIALIVKTTYWARFLLNAYKQKHNTNYGGRAYNIKTVLELRLVINERSQRTAQVSCPAPPSPSCCSHNMQCTLLTSFPPLKRPGLFETDYHTQLVRFNSHFHGSTPSSIIAYAIDEPQTYPPAAEKKSGYYI